MALMGGLGARWTSAATNASLDRERQGWVYYALSATATEQRVKIGFTTRLRPRLAAMKHETFSRGRQGVIVLAVERGTLGVEADRHEQFAELRLGRTEWFRYGADLREYLTTLDPTAIDTAFWPWTVTLEQRERHMGPPPWDDVEEWIDPVAAEAANRPENDEEG